MTATNNRFPHRQHAFQCSSASRKFLNSSRTPLGASINSVSVLFSEPKIPQSRGKRKAPRRCIGFSALQRAENSSISTSSAAHTSRCAVSVLFSEPKIPQFAHAARPVRGYFAFQCSSASRKFLNMMFVSASNARVPIVSVLFSEPKIPQFKRRNSSHKPLDSFSALQRAENSSIQQYTAPRRGCQEFQCSSASRKFLNAAEEYFVVELLGFSALQRAENSSMRTNVATRRSSIPFQCSSASRKFLNRSRLPKRVSRAGVSVLFSEPKIPQFEVDLPGTPGAGASFSALQRAENSSMENVSPYSVCERQFQCSSASRKFLNIRLAPTHASAIVEFQCSSASRKFLNFHGSAARPRRTRVSVLFSEPKIPQSICDGQAANVIFRFSALQRAENSSINTNVFFVRICIWFQCSSASRKFLNPSRTDQPPGLASDVSVLFSEPKIPQSINPHTPNGIDEVSVLFSEPKIPQSRPSHLRPSIFPTATITLRRS